MNKNDFLENYLVYCQGNEVPKSFHLWSGIHAISALVSRRVWLDQGPFTVHCNLYVVLVGKPADKKSTAMNISRKLVSQADVPVGPSSITREKIYEIMDSKNSESSCNYSFEFDDEVKQVSHLTLCCNEMVTLLSSGGNALGMIEFLTDIWDKDYHDIDTKNKGKNTIYGPYITILACMTPDQTTGLMKQDIITGGFSRRCLFVRPDEPPKPVALPKLEDYQREAWDECQRIGKEIQSMKGAFSFDASGIEAYEQWYASNHKRKLEASAPIEQYYLNTLPRYVLQVAMLLSISRDRKNLVLNAELIQKSVEYLFPIGQELGTLFTGAGRNQLADLKSRILGYIKSQNKLIPMKKILSAMFDHGNTQEIKDVLIHMRDTDVIVETMKGTSSPVVLYGMPEVVGSEPVAPSPKPDRDLDLDFDLP